VLLVNTENCQAFIFNKARLEEPHKSCKLIHTQMGSMNTSSLNNNKFYISFIDDYTRMCWIYFKKIKFEVADIFKKFKAWVKTQGGCKILVIRSDNKTKYSSGKFNKFYEVAGVEHLLIALYTP
jgi:transposase InsO family protein